MKRRHLRLAAGTLALALPLAGAAACGAEKKKTIKQEFASAEAHLSDSKAASFTLRFDDSKGSVAALITKDGGAPKPLVDALLRGSITYTTDPAGDATLKSVQTLGVSSEDLKAQLNKVNASFVVRDDQADLADIRVVAGDLYLKVDLKEIGRLAEAGGVQDFDAQLDGAVKDMGPEFGRIVADARAGKYLKLPLSKYIDQLQELAGTVAPTPAAPKSEDLKQLGTSLLAAVKPHVTVTDANDSSDERVLDVKVKARPALKAVLAALKAEKGIPFLSGAFGAVSAADIDQHVRDGEARGTITLEDGHLTQFAVDVESVRLLDPNEEPAVDSVSGARVIVDVDDSADEVDVPSNVSSVDVGKLIDQFMQAFMGTAMNSGSMSGSYSG